MLYVAAVFASPLAIMRCGKSIQAAVNLLLWSLVFLTSVVPLALLPMAHALLVVQRYYWDQRLDRMVLAVACSRVGPAT